MTPTETADNNHPPVGVGRLPTVERLHELTAWARNDLDRIDALWADVSAHKLRGGKPGTTLIIRDGRITTTPLPENPAGVDMSRHPSPETHSDPTGEAVGSGDARTEGDDRRAQLVTLDALARLATHTRGVTDALHRLRRARAALSGRLPYADAVLNDTEWVGGEADHVDRLRGQVGDEAVVVSLGERPTTTTPCICCGGTAERIRRGLCPADYIAWIRADRPDMTAFIAARNPQPPADPESPYKALKEVK